MTEKGKRGCKNLILLIGSNTLPNYIAARVLKPQKSILLLYTGKTIEPKDRLKAVLKDVMPSIEICQRCILKDGTVANEVMRSCLNLPPDSHLHYSGGTKVMAAHARMALREQNQDGSDNGKASYLDERAGILWYDDEYPVSLDSQDLGLTLSILLRLYGIKGAPSEQRDGWPTPNDAQHIAEKVLSDRLFDSRTGSKNKVLFVKKLNKKSSKLSDEVSKAINNPLLLKNFGLELSAAQVPEEGWLQNRFDAWREFLGGCWMEVLITELTRNIIKTDAVNGEVSVDVKCSMPEGRNFQIDITVIRNHRLYVISCTTSTQRRVCKSKLFEVNMRAKQLGGDLARSGLCCLLHGGDDNGDYVDQLRFDVNSMWGASNEPCVFGLDNLREWFGIKTNANTNALSKWLHLKGEGSCPY